MDRFNMSFVAAVAVLLPLNSAQAADCETAYQEYRKLSIAASTAQSLFEDYFYNGVADAEKNQALSTYYDCGSIENQRRKDQYQCQHEYNEEIRRIGQKEFDLLVDFDHKKSEEEGYFVSTLQNCTVE